MEQSLSENSFFPIPKLQSIISVLLGIFCILCFKLLIGFGRKWKNILIDWGYRSLNIPPLWSKDTIVDESVAEASSFTLHRYDGEYRDLRRVPALRLPDAWPNFLLTWMYLNSETVSGLASVWLAAINQELVKLISNRFTHVGSPARLLSSLGEFQLRLTSVRKPSAPPHLSFLETSASGSTKELHFRCTLSTPEFFLDLVFSNPPRALECDSSEKSLIIHLQQVSCRVEVICAVLDGDYVLLSWKIVSPLLTHSISVLDSGGNPVTKLSRTDVRWIKDTIYLGIQSAVTRIVLNPPCFTPVQQFLPAAATSQSRNAERNMTCRSLSVPAANSMYIRVLYAFLLDSASDPLLESLTHLSLRCEIRSNTVSRPKHVVADKVTSDALMATRGVRIETKSWPGNDQSQHGKKFLNGRLQACGLTTFMSPRSYVAVWNEEAYIPMERITSNLLDVVLFTEPDGLPSITYTQLSGQAVLPLPKFMEDPSQSQHVLLIDCSPSSLTGGCGVNDATHTNSFAHIGTLQAKFMLILRVQLLTDVSLQSAAKENESSHTNIIRVASSGVTDGTKATQFSQQIDAPLTEVSGGTGFASLALGTTVPHSRFSDPFAPHVSSDVQSLNSFPTYCTLETDSPLMKRKKRKLFSFRMHRTKRGHNFKTSFDPSDGLPLIENNADTAYPYCYSSSDTPKEDRPHPANIGSSRLQRLLSHRSFRRKRNSDRRARDSSPRHISD